MGHPGDSDKLGNAQDSIQVIEHGAHSLVDIEGTEEAGRARDGGGGMGAKHAAFWWHLHFRL